MWNEIRRALAPLGLLAAPALAHAHDGHDHALPAHGGVVGKTEHYAIEVLCTKDGVRVFPHRIAGEGKFEPIPAEKLSGTVLVVANAGKAVPLPLKPAEGRADGPLVAKVDLSKIPAKGTNVVVRLSGLPDPAEADAEVTVPFKLAALATAPATKADAKAIAAQKVCAVSGEDLGSMGTPLKVSRGSESVFICCKGCVRKIESNPDKYFATAKP